MESGQPIRGFNKEIISVDVTKRTRIDNGDRVGNKKNRRFRPPFKWRWVFIALLFLVVLLGASTLLWIKNLSIEKLVMPITSPTQMMDMNGNAVIQISSLKIEPIPIEEIPLFLQQAIVAVEDKRYYEHTGVDVFGILRAAFRNVKEGGAVEGGSTITQQLAKNVFLTNEKTFSRKLTEAAYAIKIESNYDKDQIMEMYLNQIYFGEGQWGISRASKRYFGKSPMKLTLAEAAMLAALPKAPSRYSPYRNKELTLERRNLVLGLMRDEKYISETEYNQATKEPIVVLKDKLPNNDLLGKFPSYADAVIDEAIEKYGFTERELLAGNLRIYTEINPKVQDAMETVYRNHALFPENADANQLVQSGAVITDPHTGGVRGVVGRRGEPIFRGFNYATQLVRQPGSIIKPVMVYAPALEQGYTPSSILFDGPLNINGYEPQDWDNQYRGQVTLREAVVKSWNIPAVWLLNEIKVQSGIDFVKKLGIPLEDADNNLGLALGGFSRGVSPLQMAQAFSIFPNSGQLVPAHFIIKITDPSGRVLAKAEPEETSLMSEENAYTMTQLLMDVIKEGTGSRAALTRPTAGKTGTTQLPDIAEFKGIEDGAKDAWFAGFTPEYVGVVWMGYDVTDSEHYLSTSGGHFPALVFKEMMTLALEGVPVTPFNIPVSLKNKDNKDEQVKEVRKKNDDDKEEKRKKNKEDRKKKNKED